MRSAFIATTAAVVVLAAAGDATAATTTNARTTTTTAVDANKATAAPKVSTGSHIVRFNEGSTHSPRVEHMLSVRAVTPAAAAGARSAGLATTASTVEGIDVASFQHPNGTAIDWTQVAAAQYKFTFIKASEGSYYANPYYAADASGAKSAGLLEAPYAFAIPNYSGGALQADYALDHANYAADGRTLPLILDIEYDPYNGAPPAGDGTNECYGLTPAQMVAWIGAFAAETSRRTGRPPVIYTTQDWWNSCTGDSAAFAADPLSIANFGVSTPALPTAWQGWTYWQYTNGATPPGVPTTTDASWLSSTALELAAPGNQSNQNRTLVNRQLHALDGGTPVTFSASGLPPGVHIDASTGALSGQLRLRVAAFPVSITASAAGDPSAIQNFVWDVHGKVTLGPLAGLGGSIGSPVRHQVPVADGLAGCTLRVTASRLPRGLAMNSCGSISGWPLAVGRFSVRVHVTDSSGAALATGTFRWTIGAASGRGPAGHLRLASDGKCLAALSGTAIAIEPCNTAAKQQWTIAADDTVRVEGSCLVAAASSSSAPAALTLTTCGRGQRWQLASNAVLTNLSDGRCLAATGTTNGAGAVAASCQATANNTGSASTPSPSQQWLLPAGPLTSGVPGYCASDQRVTGQRFGAVTLRPCNGTSAQAWAFAADGAVTIAGECLDLGGGATTPGTRLRLVTCSHSATQVWQLAGGPIGVHVVSPVAGLCLADPGDRAVSGVQLVIGPCVAGDPGIAWRVS